VTEHDVVLLVPRRVYEELTPESYSHGQPPINDAIEAGWVQIVDDIDYSNPVVSNKMKQSTPTTWKTKSATG